MSTIPWGEYGDTGFKPFPNGSIFKGLQVGLGANNSLDLNIMSISALLLLDIDCTQIPKHENYFFQISQG
jgi:hypothetical protein